MLKKKQVYKVNNKFCQIKNDNCFNKVIIPTNFFDKIIVGDLIDVKEINNELILEKLYERKNILLRPKLANVDWIIIIYPLSPKPKNFLDLLWWVMMYQVLGFDVSIVFSKSDLFLNRNWKKGFDIFLFLEQLSIFCFDYRNSEDLKKILNFFKNKLVVLAGNSGAGKSTFLNFLNQNLKIKTNTLSSKGTGRHTTTSSQIYEIKNIKFVDSPGFFNLNLNLTKNEIAFGWKKYKEFQTKCKYKDCLHNNPNLNCQIYQEIKKGKISLGLHNIYLTILNNKKNKIN